MKNLVCAVSISLEPAWYGVLALVFAQAERKVQGQQQEQGLQQQRETACARLRMAREHCRMLPGERLRQCWDQAQEVHGRDVRRAEKERRTLSAKTAAARNRGSVGFEAICQCIRRQG